MQDVNNYLKRTACPHKVVVIAPSVGGGWWVLSGAKPTGQCGGVEVTGETGGRETTRRHTASLSVCRCGSLLRQSYRVHAHHLGSGIGATYTRKIKHIDLKYSYSKTLNLI